MEAPGGRDRAGARRGELVVFGRKRPPDDFAAEIDAHLQLEADRLREEGLGVEEAQLAARRAFGNVTLSQERFYESGRWRWWDRLSQDVRHAARVLRKTPGFALIAILTMAVGIGATTAIFSVVDATLLHPLPYPEPDRLVSVEDDLPGVGSYNVGMSQPEWLDLERSGIFESVSPSWFDENNLTGAARPTRVRLNLVAPNYFATLGVMPALGRAFPPDDRSPGFTLGVVISDAMWQRGFGGDPAIVGKSLRLDTDLYDIVGVMPPGFRPPGRTTDERNIDVWAAMSFYGPPITYHPPRSGRNLPGAIARLKPGVTLAATQALVNGFVASLREQYPNDYPPQSAWSVRLVPLSESVFGNVRQSLVLLLGAVGLVLLIGCVNIANLLLARASARGRELAVRQALGASRRRLTAQLLTESALLSLIGGLAAIGILLTAKQLLLQLIPDNLPRLNDVTINWRVLLFATGVTVASGFAFGLAPALHAGSVDVTTALKSARGSTGGRAHARTQRLLVVTEFALSLVLMVAAGLLLRSFWDLLNAGLGFDPGQVATIRTRLPYPNDVTIDKYRTIAQEAPFLRDVLRRTRHLPGIEEAALGGSSAIPLDHTQQDPNFLFPVVVEGRVTDPMHAPRVHGSAVTPEYFGLLRMTLLRGRLFTDFDDERSPSVAIVNDAMARMFWPGANPIGQHVKLSRSATSSWTTIVGVVADARTESLKDADVPEIYASAYQRTEKHLAIFLRGQFDVAAMADRVREQVQLVDDTLPVYGAQTLNETVSVSLIERRFSTAMVGLFALTALLLAALGIYGVMSYAVSERTHELGIRLALGAGPETIARMVLRQGVALVLVGATVGLACAAGVSRSMAGVVFGVRPLDPPTFAAVSVLLIAVAMFACYIPARRATRVDPIIALRNN